MYLSASKHDEVSFIFLQQVKRNKTFKYLLFFIAILFQLSRNQQPASGIAALSTIGDGSWHGSRGKQEKIGNTFSSPSAQEANLQPAFFKPKCVIFDKDGTLVCFHTMWSPWCTDLAQRYVL